MPNDPKSCSVTLPMPLILRIGKSLMNSSTASLVFSKMYWPLGLFLSEHTLANIPLHNLKRFLNNSSHFHSEKEILLNHLERFQHLQSIGSIPRSWLSSLRRLPLLLCCQTLYERGESLWCPNKLRPVKRHWTRDRNRQRLFVLGGSLQCTLGNWWAQWPIRGTTSWPVVLLQGTL